MNNSPFTKIIADKISAIENRHKGSLSMDGTYVPDEKLMYKVSEMRGCVNPIAKLWRIIACKLRISFDIFKNKHRLYEEEIGKSATEINTDFNNLQKTIFIPNLTVRKLEHCLTVLGYDLVDFSVHIKNKNTGEVSVYSVSDALRMDADNISSELETKKKNA